MGYGFCGDRAYIRDEEDDEDCIEFSKFQHKKMLTQISWKSNLMT